MGPFTVKCQALSTLSSMSCMAQMKLSLGVIFWSSQQIFFANGHWCAVAQETSFSKKMYQTEASASCSEHWQHQPCFSDQSPNWTPRSTSTSGSGSSRRNFRAVSTTCGINAAAVCWSVASSASLECFLVWEQAKRVEQLVGQVAEEGLCILLCFWVDDRETFEDPPMWPSYGRKRRVRDSRMLLL